MGNKSSCIHEDRSVGLLKTLSKEDFRVLEKLSLQCGGILEMVVNCFLKTKSSKPKETISGSSTFKAAELVVDVWGCGMEVALLKGGY